MMIQSKYLFKEQEPEDLQALSIDYDSLQYFKALIFNYDEATNARVLLFDCELSSASMTLIIRNSRQDDFQQEWVYKWLNIQLWLASYNLAPKLGDAQDYTLQIQEHESAGILELKLDNDDAYNTFKALIRDSCIIVKPSLDLELRYIHRIGKGAQAYVDLYKTQLTSTKESFAVKKFKLNDKSRIQDIPQAVLNEITFLRELKVCENITQIEAVYFSEGKMCFVMKFAKYGSILRHLMNQKVFTEEQIRIIMAQLILAIDLIHRNRIIHRDLKPDNILLMDKEQLHICISDLGMACKMDDLVEVENRCGTPGYVAPEILKGQPFTAKSDIFSMGSFFYNLLTGKNLFNGRDGKEVLLANKFQNPIPVINMNVTNVSQECKDLLQWMTNILPEGRPTAEQCINHKWFQKDREAMQNSLLINKSQQLLATYFFQPVVQQNSGQESPSIRIADNYYEFVQNLSYYGSPQANKRLLSPSSKNSSKGSQSPGLKICYNQIISQSRAKSGEQAQLNFQKAANNQQEQSNPKKPSLLPNVLQKYSGNDQDRNERIKEDVKSYESIDEFSLEEYTPRIVSNCIEKKYLDRTQINDLLLPNRMMSAKNVKGRFFFL